MSDIHKRDYGCELARKKSRRTQKRRASQRQLTAKFKKELVGKKRQEQTAESRAAEQAEQSAELLTQEGAARLASGATAVLRGEKNRTGNERAFSNNDPSIHPSDQTTAPDETVPWSAKKPADAWRQQAKEERSKNIRTERSGSRPVSAENGQRAEYHARSKSARASVKPASSQNSRPAASERGRRLAIQRKRQEATAPSARR